MNEKRMGHPALLHWVCGLPDTQLQFPFPAVHPALVNLNYINVQAKLCAVDVRVGDAADHAR